MNGVSAYILGDGALIKAEDLEQFAKAGNAKRLTTDDPFRYRADDALQPPYNLSRLVDFLELNTEHYRCVKMKSQDIVGAYEIVPRDPSAEPNVAQQRQLEDWLATCNDELTFDEVLERTWTDVEATGNGYLEIIRDTLGKTITGIEHVSAKTVRIRKGDEGYVQRRGKDKVFFRKYGDTRAMRATTGEVVDGTLTEGERANELMHFLNYHPKSDFYGMPDFLPALGAMIGNQEVRDYNLQFFSNNAIPQYAIIVTGGALNNDTMQVIGDYFREHIKGQAHKTLVIPVPDPNVKVQLVPLGARVTDGGFQIYRTGNRDEIIRAHGVPPARIGIIESGNLGSGSGDSQTHTYKDAIVEPRQTRLEYRINDKLLRDGLQITDWLIRFQDIDLSDDKANSEIARGNVAAGLWSPKEGRQYVGRFAGDTYDGDEVPAFVMTAAGPVLMRDMADLAATRLERARNPQPLILPTTNMPPPTPVAKADTLGGGGAREAAIAAPVEQLTGQVATFLKTQGPLLAGAVVAALTAGASATEVADGLPLAGWADDLGPQLTPALTEVYVAGANGAAETVGVFTSFDLENPRAVAFAKQRAAELLTTGADGQTSIAESTRAALRGLIATALEQGTSYTDLAKQIEASYSFSAQRAAGIARYELGAAYVEGNVAGWEESGVVDGYTWSTMNDDLVRPEHLENQAAGVVPIGEAFPSGDLRPPTDPNCRCDLVPHVKD